MRVEASLRALNVEPGTTTTIQVRVRNTAQVIDGVSARVIGLPDECVRAEPSLLPLFPDASGQIALALTIPPTLPAGRHALMIEVLSHAARAQPQHVDLEVNVAAHPGLDLTSQPRSIRARRQARFALTATNAGNTPLLVELSAVDADRAVRVNLAPPSVRLDPGASAAVVMTVTGPRLFTGGEHERSVTAKARAVPPPPEAAPAPMGAAMAPADAPTVPMAPADAPTVSMAPVAAIERIAAIRFKQRPLIGRGLMTALTLAAIIALWAGAFLLGMTKVFSADPMTKQAPASFFLPDGAGVDANGNPVAQPTGANGSATSPGSSGSPASPAVVAPAGVLPKSGQMPAGSGGQIAGTVTAATDGRPIGGILVQAKRMTLTGLVTVSSAATQADGTYTLAGLFPTAYFIEFSASGYTTVWFPAAPSQAAATAVTARADGTVPNTNAVLTGRPASISGNVNPGDTTKKVITTVTARALAYNGATSSATGGGAGGSSGGAGPSPASVQTTTPSGPSQSTKTYQTKTNGAGAYKLSNLPAPASYQLTFTAAGYQASTVVDTVAGGDNRLEPTVILGAALGSISGTVTDGANPIGGATVTTTVNGSTLSVTTPTSGQVGTFTLGNLVTPGTYVVTFEAAGYGSLSKVIDLDAGQSLSGQRVSLVNGTGSVTGRVLDPAGNGLGGVTVTVGGASNGTASSGAGQPTGSLTTTTVSTGGSAQVGGFEIFGLAVPGSYTLTFTIAGYAPQTIPIILNANAAPTPVLVTLAAQNGSITGTVTIAGSSSQPAGATITATDGLRAWTVTYSGKSADLPKGGYLITGLAPGTYSVTVTYPGMYQQTGMVTVTAGKTSTLNLVLNAS
ncbi:MAG: carboxypeptidase-like regulatory domain-containing protein [Actinomycetia bacterium]|nr:carboxypeptidase-like regulatory domain-containing protein [Actinomycetes bacterium]